MTAIFLDPLQKPDRVQHVLPCQVKLYEPLGDLRLDVTDLGKDFVVHGCLVLLTEDQVLVVERVPHIVPYLFAHHCDSCLQRFPMLPVPFLDNLDQVVRPPYTKREHVHLHGFLQKLVENLLGLSKRFMLLIETLLREGARMPVELAKAHLESRPLILHLLAHGLLDIVHDPNQLEQVLPLVDQTLGFLETVTENPLEHEQFEPVSTALVLKPDLLLVLHELGALVADNFPLLLDEVLPHDLLLEQDLLSVLGGRLALL